MIGTDWRDDLRAGDIIRDRSGTLRTIIEATRAKTGRLRCVVLPILRCSWTERPYTHVHRNDLVPRFTPTGKRASRRFMESPLVRRMLSDEAHSLYRDKRTLFCCDVIGVVA